MDSRQIIDYADQDDATQFRAGLYAAIHDRVSQHIETMKQNVAQNLMQAQEEPSQEQEVENT
jgi:hypothetical protein